MTLLPFESRHNETSKIKFRNFCLFIVMECSLFRFYLSSSSRFLTKIFPIRCIKTNELIKLIFFVLQNEKKRTTKEEKILPKKQKEFHYKNIFCCFRLLHSLIVSPLALEALTSTFL
jgi:hypothetical protein